MPILGAQAIGVGAYGFLRVPAVTTTTPSFVGGTSGDFGGSSTFSIPINSLSGGLSSAPQSGDVVIVAVAAGFDTASTNSMSVSGYTSVASIVSDPSTASGDDLLFTVAYKRLTASDTSISVDGARADATTYAVHVWRNINATPIDVSSTTVFDVLGIATPPSITPVTTGAVILSIMGLGSDTANATFSNSSMSNLVTAGDPSLLNQESSVAIASAIWSGSGSYTPTGWSTSDGDATLSGAAVTMALRPA